MRFGLNEDLIRFIEERRERWYHKYDNDDILVLTQSENNGFWKRIDEIERFHKFNPDSGLPTLNGKGVSSEDLETYISTRCAIFARGKMREVDFSLDNLEGLIEDKISYHPEYHNKQPLLFWGFLGFGVICEFVVYFTAWRSIFDSSVFGGIILGLALWAIIAVSFFFLCYLLTSAGSFLVNFFIRYKTEKLLLHMEVYDSVNIRLTNLYSAVKMYETEKWKKEYTNRKITQRSTLNFAERKPSIPNEVRVEDLKSWPLLEFARVHGKMQLLKLGNNTTNESFKVCMFTDEGGQKTYVSFDEEMGELTPNQIIQQKETLQVVKQENGTFVLRKTCTNDLVKQ